MSDKGQREQVQDALYDWVEKALNDAECPCPIVWNNTGGVREKPPFVSLQMIGNARLGFPWEKGVDAKSGTQTLFYEMRQTVSIHGWGESCMDRLEAVSDSIDFEECKELLRGRGVVVDRITDVTEAFEDRANDGETHGFFDISVTFIRKVKEPMNWIEKVTVGSVLPPVWEDTIKLEELEEEQNGGN